MNKKVISFFGSVFLVFGFTLTSCDFLDVLNSHDHTYSSAYEYNETNHWHPSTCGHDVKSNEEEHTFTSVVTDPTYESGGYTTYTCSVCGYSYRGDETSQLEHNYSSTWSHDEDSHWRACIDEGYEHLRADEESHSYITSVTDPTYESGGYTTYTCSVCGYSYTDSETSPLSITITWQNYDGTILEVDEDVPYGSMPSYDGETPRRDGNGQYSYTFSGWSPEISEVVCDVTYVAQFSYEDDLTYTLNSTNDGYVVSKGSNSANYTDLFIPEKHNNLPVTNIGEDAFRGCTSLTSIVVPSNVTYIGSSAFRGCTSLTSIVVPSNVTYIGSSAFYYCASLTIYCEASSQPSGWSLTWNNSGRPIVWNYQGINGVTDDSFKYAITLDSEGNKCIAITEYIGETTNLVIPSSINIGEEKLPVKEICEYAFYNCSKLTSIKIPNSVTYIGSYAFGDCSSLKSVTIGENSQLQTIGDYAFYDCDNLTTVTIGENSQLQTIGNYAFFGCNNLTTVTIGENSQLQTIGDHAFTWCFELTSIKIPNSVTYIGSYAFYDCSSLKSVTISENSQLNTIGNYAFNDCSKLTSIKIPNSVTYIGSYAFEDCSSLKSVTISENSQLQTIGSYAFSNCSSLTSIYIPSSVTSIGSYAFNGCPLIIYCGVSSKPDGWDYDWNPIDCPIIWGCTGISGETYDGFSYVICQDESNNKYITITGYSGEATEVTIPSSINVDGDSISVKVIAEKVFYNNRSITSVSIPSSVTSIGDSVFYDCLSLTSIYIPSSVTSIGDSVFFDCFSLTIYCEASSKPDAWASDWNDSRPVVWGYAGVSGTTDDGFAYSICQDESNNKYITITGYSGEATEVTIPSSINVDGDNISVKVIAEKVFYNNRSITSVSIPSSVTSIRSRAFSYCSSLTTVTFAENSQLESIGMAAFAGCTSLTSIVIPNSVTSIGEFAFERCSKLTSIYIPSSVTSIGSNAFLFCTSLTIYCETSSKPSGWDSNWNYSNCPVVWGVKVEKDFVYYTNETEVVLAMYIGSSSTPVIPLYVGDNLKVTKIENLAISDFVYFEGGVSDWEGITKAEEPAYIVVYYSESEPTDTENYYWRYVDGEPTLWEVA